MKTSQNGINLIKSFEGLSLKAYKAVASEKYYTIGYGHYGTDVNAGQTINEAQAEDLLRQDLAKFEQGVSNYVKVGLNQNQFDALVSWSYNLGLGNLQKSDMLTYINKGDFANAAKELILWNKAGGKVLAGLVKRRAAEQALFTQGVPTPAPAPQPKPAPKPAAPKYVLPDGILQRGMTGNNVKLLQIALNAANFNCGTPDGSFGPKTLDALKRFQSVYCNPVDGVYGQKTKVALAKKLGV